ncbi:hypothetical protein KIW84_054279 [Lathyrus oleraceus]|uniref:K Homology domain-containing protein n=1 Tax=Pisum sativum TaxID=3888 RepID=A0A9D4WTY4_PEA|nr:hypothetical protein KIW84_054279 [Pisum sativum]
MICHLMGTSDAVASAEKLINEVLAEAEAGASAGGGTRRMAAQSRGDEFSMQIPNNKVGLIIGKGGETIKSMQASTGARIQITFNVKHQLRMEDRIWIQLQSGSEFRCGGFSENRRMYYLGFELISEFASVPNWGGLPRLILALLEVWKGDQPILENLDFFRVKVLGWKNIYVNKIERHKKRLLGRISGIQKALQEGRGMKA